MPAPTSSKFLQRQTTIRAPSLSPGLFDLTPYFFFSANSRSIYYCCLPPTGHATPPLEMVPLQINLAEDELIRGFKTDPVHGLIAVLVMKVPNFWHSCWEPSAYHLRFLSFPGLKYPNPTPCPADMTIMSSCPLEQGTPKVQIAFEGTNIGVLVPGRFIVYNWRTGMCRLNIDCTEQVYLSFTFLSTDTILLPSSKTSTLDLWTCTASFFPICSLALPEAKPVGRGMDTYIHCTPLAASGLPAKPDIVVTEQFVYGGYRGSTNNTPPTFACAEFIIPAAVLIDVVSQCLITNFNNYTMPWVDWGAHTYYVSANSTLRGILHASRLYVHVTDSLPTSNSEWHGSHRLTKKNICVCGKAPDTSVLHESNILELPLKVKNPVDMRVDFVYADPTEVCLGLQNGKKGTVVSMESVTCYWCVLGDGRVLSVEEPDRTLTCCRDQADDWFQFQRKCQLPLGGMCIEDPKSFYPITLYSYLS